MLVINCSPSAQRLEEPVDTFCFEICVFIRVSFGNLSEFLGEFSSSREDLHKVCVALLTVNKAQTPALTEPVSHDLDLSWTNTLLTFK